MKIAAFVIAGFLLLLIGAWLIVLPEAYLQAMIENSLQRPDVQVEMSGFRKGLFYNLSADSMSVVKDGTELLAVEDVKGRMNPFSLLLLRFDMHFSARIGGGAISGRVNLVRGGRNILVSVKEADLGAIPFVGLLGISGSGTLSGIARMDTRAGEVKFDIANAKFGSGTFGGISVPLHFFQSARGALSVADGNLAVTSFALEGTDIYARIKGKISAGKMDLTMEVMPKPSFIEKNPAMALLDRFKVSPGYYSIPVNSDINF